MSRTRRKDDIDIIPPTPDRINWVGEPCSTKPTAEEVNRAHRDKKKGPGSAFKKCQRKRDSVKPKQKLRTAIAQGQDLDGLILPDAKKHDRWDYY